MKLDDTILGGSEIIQVIQTDLYTASNLTGPIQDLQGFEDGWQVLIISYGDIDAAVVGSTIQVTESADSAMAGATNVGAAITVLNTDDNTIKVRVDRLFDRKRYCRVLFTYAGTGNCTLGVSSLLLGAKSGDYATGLTELS